MQPIVAQFAVFALSDCATIRDYFLNLQRLSTFRAGIMSTEHWFSIRIMSTHGARIDCIAQLASDDREYIESRVGRVAVCNRCAGPTKCKICALGGAIVLAGIRDAEWYPRDPTDDSTNSAYVFTMLSVWKGSDRHYSKSR